MKTPRFSFDYIALFDSLPPLADTDLTPCTSGEVRLLDSMLPSPFALPEAIRDFYLLCGKKAGGLFERMNFSYEFVHNALKNEYRDIRETMQITEDEEDLPRDFFLLNGYLGTSFSYVLLSEGDNPPVYFWELGPPLLENAVKACDTFTDFVKMRVEEYAESLSM